MSLSTHHSIPVPPVSVGRLVMLAASVAQLVNRTMQELTANTKLPAPLRTDKRPGNHVGYEMKV